MWNRRRPSKAPKSEKTKTTNSDPYRSGLERKIAGVLLALGITFGYETKRVPYKVERQASYRPDFIFDNGVCVEVKGYFSSADRSKYLSVKASNPALDLRFVFGNADNKLNKLSKTTYKDWAERHGFPWANKVIPPEWAQEPLKDPV